jgi:hypothetical protein
VAHDQAQPSLNYTPGLSDFIEAAHPNFADMPIKASTPETMNTDGVPTLHAVRERSTRVRRPPDVFDPCPEPPVMQSQAEQPAVTSSQATNSGKGSRSAIEDDWDVFVDAEGIRRRLHAVAWIHLSSAADAQRYGEVIMGDGVQCTNTRRRPLYDILTVGPDGKNIVFMEVLLLNCKMSSYSWIYWDAIPALMGHDFCRRVQLIMTDGDIWQVFSQFHNIGTRILPLSTLQILAIEGACGVNQTFPSAVFRVCAFHFLKQPFDKLRVTLPETVKAECHELYLQAWAILTLTDRDAATKSLRHITSSLKTYGSDRALTLATSLEIHSHRWMGPEFSRVQHFGVFTASPVEGNHGVYKRPVERGGAGISAKSAPEHLVERLAILQRTRQVKVQRTMDTSLQLPANLPESSEGIILAQHVTQLAVALVGEQRSAATFCVISQVTRDYISVTSASGNIRKVRLILQSDGKGLRLLCDCLWSFQFLLPCRHVICVKKQVELTDIHVRWWLRYWRGEWQDNIGRGIDGYIGAFLVTHPYALEECDNISLIDDHDHSSSIPLAMPDVSEPGPHAIITSSDSLYRLFQEIQSESLKSDARHVKAYQAMEALLEELSEMQVTPSRAPEARFKSFNETLF